MNKRVYWLGHLKSWGEAGISGKAYCGKHGLNYANFMRWKKVLSVEPSEASAGYFTKFDTEYEELDFHINGVYLRVHRDISQAALGQIIHAILHSAQAC